MVMNKLNTAKIVLALVAVAALTLVAVGLASAQIAANQTYTGTAPNTAAPNNGGFFGWIGNCFGYAPAQSYYGSQNVTPQAPTNSSAPEPYQPYQPNQGNYDYGYGYGPCWAR